jgi:hypothetical protein
MKYLLCVFVLGLALAQTPAPSLATVEEVTAHQIYDLMLQYQIKTQEGLPEVARLNPFLKVLLIAPGIYDLKLLEILHSLSHGWADCSKAILGIGCNEVPPVVVEILSDEANKENFRTLATPRLYKPDLIGVMVGAATYLLPRKTTATIQGQSYLVPPGNQAGLLLFETPDFDYVFTGPLIAGTGTGLVKMVKVVKVAGTPGLGQVLRQQMFIETIKAQARRWVP